MVVEAIADNPGKRREATLTSQQLQPWLRPPTAIPRRSVL